MRLVAGPDISWTGASPSFSLCLPAKLHAGLSTVPGGLGYLSRAKAVADTFHGHYFSSVTLFDEFMIEIIVSRRLVLTWPSEMLTIDVPTTISMPISFIELMT